MTIGWETLAFRLRLSAISRVCRWTEEKRWVCPGRNGNQIGEERSWGIPAQEGEDDPVLHGRIEEEAGMTEFCTEIYH